VESTAQHRGSKKTAKRTHLHFQNVSSENTREREKTGHYQGAFHALDHQLLTSAMGQKLDCFK